MEGKAIFNDDVDEECNEAFTSDDERQENED